MKYPLGTRFISAKGTKVMLINHELNIPGNIEHDSYSLLDCGEYDMWVIRPKPWKDMEALLDAYLEKGVLTFDTSKEDC